MDKVKKYFIENAANIEKFFCLAVVLVVLILVADADNTRSGDEVITYGMANSYYKGWMLSSGRVGDYLKSEIIGNNIKDTAVNLYHAGMDVLTNRSQAGYFTYPRPKETGWYLQSEVNDWFTVSSKERFSYDSVYMNALTDDANSFLYYSLVHSFSSIAGKYGGSKWCAFAVNIIFVCAIYLLMAKASEKFGLKRPWIYVPGFFWGISYSCIDQATDCRAYIMSMFFATLLFYVHRQLWDDIKYDKSERYRLHCIHIWIVYLTGYISHYTMGIWLVILGMNTIVHLAISARMLRKKYMASYILTDIMAVAGGFLVDPMSIAGLLSKLSVRTGNKIGGAALEAY